MPRARRCVELGFAFANALEDQVVAGAMEKFQPDLTVRGAALTVLTRKRGALGEEYFLGYM